MPRSRRFVPDSWTLVADPSPCDPISVARALAFCPRDRIGEECMCRIDVGEFIDDLEKLGVENVADAFDDVLDAEGLVEVAVNILSALRRLPEGDLKALIKARTLALRRLGRLGSGLRSLDDL